MDRRDFLAGAALAALTPTAARGKEAGRAVKAPASSPVPVIHMTDLFRPHMDPDDHWDLACQFALAHRREIDLRAVVIDFPPRPDLNPDIAAVAQMNYITHQAVPVVVGATAAQARDRTAANPAAEFVIDALDSSPRPVVIHVVGSCRDIADALRRAPDVFGRQCKAIYLNAGTGSADPEQAARLEYNVTLDPGAYAGFFEPPCPLYWMPCFEHLDQFQTHETMRHGTYWRFRQGDMLGDLSPQVQGYFAGVFHRDQGYDWLWSLRATEPERLAPYMDQVRNMWCTAGFLHAAGLTVNTKGQIVPLAGADTEPVFGFVPIRVSCSAEGVTRWSPGSADARTHIFRIHDLGRYAAVMTRALRTLLQALP